MIRRVTVEPARVTTAAADLIVRVELGEAADGVEIRGVLVGPRCPGISTIEVAYPLRATPDPAGDGHVLRVVVPEPNLWSPATPFRYDGRVDVWRHGVKLDGRSFAVELRPQG